MITGVLEGRLGNQMFQYAVTRTVAEKNGFDYGFHSYESQYFWQGGNLFFLHIPTTNTLASNLFVEDSSTSFDKRINNIGDDTKLRGFFQNEKYFDHAKARQWFQPNMLLNHFGYEKNLFCIINVRGGDYRETPQFLLPLSYYDEAKSLMLSINPDLKFIVVTDDMVRARAMFPDDFIISGGMESDFILLYSAKYLIIANSTFSWWAAWLNENNTVIAPQGWLNYNRNRDVFMPSGIKVERFIWI